MQSLPLDINTRDIQQWLGTSWYLANGVPARFSEVRTTLDGSYQIAGTNTKGELVVCSAHEVMVHWPLCGSINVTEEYAAHVTRLPARVYNRSYCSEQVQVQVPRIWDLLPRLARKITDEHLEDLGYINGDTPAVIEALFNPKYVPADRAMTLVLEGAAHSVAVTPSLIVTSSDGQNIMVVYRGKYVADIRNDMLINFGGDDITERKILKQFNIRRTG